jgi:AraC-like DNA-binding protein
MAQIQLARSPIPAIDVLSVVSFTESEPREIHRIPDGSVSLLFRAHGGGGDLVVLGPITRAVRKRAGGVRHTLRAVLSPLAGRAVLGVSLDRLADRIVRLEALWGAAGRELGERMASATPPAAARLLTAAVAAQPWRVSDTDRHVGRALAMLRDGRAVAEIARDLGINERTLRRVFSERIGLPPKRMARILRLQQVLVRARATRIDWARLASELGYFDQSHLVNDFRDLLGTTPAAFESGRQPAIAQLATLGGGRCAR